MHRYLETRDGDEAKEKRRRWASRQTHHPDAFREDKLCVAAEMAAMLRSAIGAFLVRCNQPAQ
jgi:hypothetical protein